MPLVISVGVFYEGTVFECEMNFTHHTPELIYCVPNSELIQNKALLQYCADIDVNILYSMSGAATEEKMLLEGSINVLIGQGQTAEVLRNLCWRVLQKDIALWKELVVKMKDTFGITLLEPYINPSRGTIILQYRKPNISNPLDISLSGRGQLQMLLLISYLFSHSNSILLLDEPDAHLEILRQRSIYGLLKELSEKNKNQIIIATHSEVILDEALNTNLTLLIEGCATEISDKKFIKTAIKELGTEHYYKARLKKSILYVEGSTDIDYLREFSKVVGNDVLAKKLLSSTINVQYIPGKNLKRENDYDELQNYRRHFQSLQSVVPELVGVAILDRDNGEPLREDNRALKVFTWSKYEFENFFVLPDALLKFAGKYYENQNKPVFTHQKLESFNLILNERVKSMIFRNKKTDFDDYNVLPTSLKRAVWDAKTQNIKMSEFLEGLLELVAKQTNEPIMINKGQYYQIIQYLDKSDVVEEVFEALDLVSKYIT